MTNETPNVLHPVSGGDEENNCTSDDQVNSSPSHHHHHSDYNLPSLPKELIMRAREEQQGQEHPSPPTKSPLDLAASLATGSLVSSSLSPTLHSRVNMKVHTKFGPYTTKIRKDPSPTSFNWKVSLNILYFTPFLFEPSQSQQIQNAKYQITRLTVKSACEKRTSLSHSRPGWT